MENSDKLLKNVSKIIKVKGFIIFAEGDPSVGINPTSWKLEEDFYFDNKEELETFRTELKVLFESYCGDITYVETYEEYQTQIDAEDIEYFKEFPIRYLIRDREYGSDTFKQANFCASYSSDVGTGIHTELPTWIPEKGNTDSEVIKSTNPMYKEILLKAAERLERKIRDEEYILNIAKTNLRIIAKELNLGLKAKK